MKIQKRQVLGVKLSRDSTVNMNNTHIVYIYAHITQEWHHEFACEFSTLIAHGTKLFPRQALLESRVITCAVKEFACEATGQRASIVD